MIRPGVVGATGGGSSGEATSFLEEVSAKCHYDLGEPCWGS
jgi:hypothetical protein